MWGDGIYPKPELDRAGVDGDLFLLSSVEEMLMTLWPELGQELNG